MRDFRPEGLLLNTDTSNNYARGLIAQRGASAVQALLKKWAADPEHLDVVAAATILWELLTKETKILTKLTLRSQLEKPLAGDVWQINSEKLVVERSQALHRCTRCQRIVARPAPKAACTRYNCHGTTVAEQPDQEKYDVWLMGHPLVMVSAEENTAQVPGEVRNRVENDFKSANGRTNCEIH